MGIRAVLVLLLVSTVCLISLLDAIACFRQAIDVEINPSLLSLASLAAGFYFGQKTNTSPGK